VGRLTLQAAWLYQHAIDKSRDRSRRLRRPPGDIIFAGMRVAVATRKAAGIPDGEVVPSGRFVRACALFSATGDSELL
jgi:hypothetical protein